VTLIVISLVFFIILSAVISANITRIGHFFALFTTAG
jgi:hypothetical protein